MLNFSGNYFRNNYDLVSTVESDAWKVDEIDDWLRNRVVKL